MESLWTNLGSQITTSSEETKGELVADLSNVKCLRAFSPALDKTNQKPLVQKKIQPSNSPSVKAESSSREISPCQDIYYAIKRIETQILVLQYLSQVANPLKSVGRQMEEHVTESPAQIGHQIPRNLTNLQNSPMENSKSSTGMVGRNETPWRSMSQFQEMNARTSSQTSKFVHGFYVPESVAE